MSIDDFNFWNDSRVRRDDTPTTVTVTDNEGAELDVALPMKWEVCPVCEGKGTHVNPAIDCGGISAEEFADDPDFAESYMRGDYDQRCNRCDGRTTVRAVDTEALSLDPMLERAYLETIEQLRRDRDEWLAELRAGA